MDSLDTSLVCIIGACAMLCNIIILLGKTDMHEDQRLATGGCFLLSLCLTVLEYSFKEHSLILHMQGQFSCCIL